MHRTVPLYSEDGSIPRILVVIENITERKHFEDSLRESEAKYLSIMESMKADVYICSHDFRLEYLNSAMLKRTGRDATGDLCYKAIHDFDEKCPWCMHAKVMQGENVEIEVAIPDTGKTYLPFAFQRRFMENVSISE